MAATSIADKLAKLEKKIAKREKTIADETKELDKDRAEYNKLYITFLSDKYKLSGKELFSDGCTNMLAFSSNLWYSICKT